MADAVPLSLDPSEITTTKDFKITPSSVRSSAAPSHARSQAITQKVMPIGRLYSSSQPGHQRFCVTLGKHALSDVMDAPLFRNLSVSEFNEIGIAGQERIFSHNESLFGEGDPVRRVSIITSGYAKTIRHSASGKLMILHVPRQGDVLEGLGCSPGSTHSAEARALCHCRVFSWELDRFEWLIKQFPVLGRNSMHVLVERMRILEGRIHELATERVPQRLAKSLLRFILQTQSFARPPVINLTGEDLAQMAGTTQFTVSRLLCDWAAKRIIEPERTAILVQNLPGLIAVAMQVDGAE